MPAKSKKQANLFKAALGKHPTGAALKIKNSLSKDKIKDFTHESKFITMYNKLLESLSNTNDDLNRHIYYVYHDANDDFYDPTQPKQQVAVSVQEMPINDRSFYIDYWDSVSEISCDVKRFTNLVDAANEYRNVLEKKFKTYIPSNVSMPLAVRDILKRYIHQDKLDAVNKFDWKVIYTNSQYDDPFALIGVEIDSLSNLKHTLHSDEQDDISNW